MTLYVLKHRDETWRAFVHRRAVDYGLEEEALGTYDRKLAEGMNESNAAASACNEWDLMYYADDQSSRYIQTD